MIVAKHLEKQFGDTQAVCDVTFSVQHGEILGLLGPNGAGKTTTLKMLTTALRPSRGRAYVAGFDVCAQPAEARKRIGYLPEIPALYPELSVEEMLSFAADTRGLHGAQRCQALHGAFDQCELGSVRRKLCRQLSRGFRQRLGFALSLLHDPQVLILDEPSGGLDPRQMAHMRALVSSFQGKKTVIVSTHLLGEVTEICNRVVIMSRGRIAHAASVKELAGQKLEQVFLDCVTERCGSLPESALALQEVG